MSDVPENVRLPAGGWRLWEHFALRGPGFPAEGVLRLAPPGLALAADKFGPGQDRGGPEWEAFTEAFSAAAVHTAELLQRIAATPRFRAAVAWQNPAVLRTGIAPFLNWTPTAAGRTSMPRQREELVAHYWQRFCVKNDTIGFFGPVGWGRWDLSARGVTVDPGEGFLAGSRVYFASWAVDALARSLGEDPALMAWIPPCRVSFVRVADGAVRLPGRPPQRLTGTERTVLGLCDGRRTVAEIAAEAGIGRQEAADTVRLLAGKRWVHWRLDVPSSTHPERALRAVLERVGDRRARERALEKLAVLERGRDAVQAAGTDADALTAAIGALEADFAALTATAAQRAKGERTAPCRGLVYSDARRAATATAGAALLAELAPLELCLTAARWMTNRFAEAVGARIRGVYDRLRAQAADGGTGGTGGVVDLGTLWLECLPSPHPKAADDIAAIQAELRAKWARVLDVPQGARRVRLAGDDIAARVREEFGEPGAGWSLARYVSPDVLILAEDREAVERGDFELVLGEMHCALNTMGASLFVHQHPDPAELVAETTRDFPGPRLLPMLAKELPLKWSARSRPSLERPEDYCVALVDQTGDPHRPRTVLGADVAVEERGGRLVAVLPDGAEFPLLDVFANTLTQRVMDRFTLRPEGDHTPRITVDRMVVARETWTFPVASLAFAEEKTEAGRFVRARQWRREHDLPRFVFVVSPAEPRPFYVDFDSPVYVTILAKALRRLARKDPGARVRVSEMLPTPEQAWLTDDEGNTYTSELRFVAVDRTVTDPAAGRVGEEEA
ncbi:lantibiotic dehydratase [Streptomyces radiopugnans]|uniref:Lantibiotic dehydratase, C terminus n=1 Tax=Streptomyces radiopugnans TaxID=403935 RepID=A0A1H9DFZ8_9ACTN|nr:lantibiotic dehydratase [Streptomyces radiopugnans]SEQ12432.1 Lantibiotic dehydratase, C terminus [Streptomyces radiopugnans]